MLDLRKFSRETAAKLNPHTTSVHNCTIIEEAFRTVIEEAKQDKQSANGWVLATIAPAHWEGKLVWMWHGDSMPPSITTLPYGYSRDRDHCGGVYVRLFFYPPTPEKVFP